MQFSSKLDCPKNSRAGNVSVGSGVTHAKILNFNHKKLYSQAIFSPNSVVFEAKIGQIRKLLLSKLIYRPGLNDLPTFGYDAKHLLCLFT